MVHLCERKTKECYDELSYFKKRVKNQFDSLKPRAHLCSFGKLYTFSSKEERFWKWKGALKTINCHKAGHMVISVLFNILQILSLSFCCCCISVCFFYFISFAALSFLLKAPDLQPYKNISMAVFGRGDHLTFNRFSRGITRDFKY